MAYSSRPLIPHADKLPPMISALIRQARPQTYTHVHDQWTANGRRFHDYFVTRLPSSSLHPDSRSTSGFAHRFPRRDSVPVPAATTTQSAASSFIPRDTTVVRIPLKSAKHHFGASVSRGSRPYNEDSHQAGVIEVAAFARRPPKSVTARSKASGEGTAADSASGDPQVFYFGVFDGHGGAECSGFLKESLHEYIENSSKQFELRSSLRSTNGLSQRLEPGSSAASDKLSSSGSKAPASNGNRDDSGANQTVASGIKQTRGYSNAAEFPHPGDSPLLPYYNKENGQSLETTLTRNWKDLVGGYFRRFKPSYFSIYQSSPPGDRTADDVPTGQQTMDSGVAIEEVLTYAFLKADYDFVSAQAAKQEENQDMAKAERPLNDGDILDRPGQYAGHIGGPKRFTGGSTCSVAMVSTPSPTPFWNPATPASMLVAHVGDTRIIICSTATGNAIPLTTNHHPSSPVESTRLRRYAATFVTDSFGEERISGLANTRAFGDIASKRIGVSAEPEIKRVELGAAEYSFMVLASDGVAGTLNDQEIVDIVKEAKTPEQAARDVVSFATEVSSDGDNATCLVVRMGGWERRQEGGHGSLRTKESREWKREDASSPSNRRR